MDGWATIGKAARYADISTRTMRDWVKNDGLKHSRLKSGRIRIKYEWIDAFLESFEASEAKANQVKQVVNDVMAEFNRRKNKPVNHKGFQR